MVDTLLLLTAEAPTPPTTDLQRATPRGTSPDLPIPGSQPPRLSVIILSAYFSLSSSFNKMKLYV